MKQENFTVDIDVDLEDLIPDFLQNKRNEIGIIRASLNEDDFENIARIAHKIKGSGGGYGFTEMSKIAQMIEVSTKAKNKEEISNLLDRFIYYMDNLEIVYKEIW